MSAQSPQPLPPNVIAALQRGNLVEAIKLLRTAGNIDLKQAKQAIEQHLDRSKVARATVGEAFGSLLQIPGVADAIRKGNKIDAIRILREKTGLGLKEAKDSVEQFPGSSMGDGTHPEPPRQPPLTQPTPWQPKPWQPTLSRHGLAPGEVPQTIWSRWWIVGLIILVALTYYLYMRA